ncbi:MAG: sensor domain-containing diguanylate cyclase [Arenimonas sp.]
MKGAYGASDCPALLRAIVESAPVSIVVSDRDGGIRLVNGETERLFGYPRRELIGQSIDVLVPRSFQDGHSGHRSDFLDHPSPRRMGAGGDLEGMRKDGTMVAIEVGLTPVEVAGELLVLSVAIDVTERKRLEDEIRRINASLETRVRERTLELESANREKESHLVALEAQKAELERLSREDDLTGLPNRRDFDERLELEIKRCERAGSPLALAMLDLDRFKEVNDSHGHALGDEVLREVAQLIRIECRAPDASGRYGGEEFVMALPGATLAGGIALCERVRLAVENFEWNSLREGLAITLSGGVSAWHPGIRASELLAEADTRLYDAKRGGRNRIEPRS